MKKEKEIKVKTTKKVVPEIAMVEEVGDIKVKVNKKFEVQYIYNDGKIVVLEKSNTYMMWFRDIIMIVIDESQDNSIKFECVKGRNVEVNGTLKEIETILDYPDFILTERGY